jgi:hypothetical protein
MFGHGTRIAPHTRTRQHDNLRFGGLFQTFMDVGNPGARRVVGVVVTAADSGDWRSCDDSCLQFPAFK